MRSYRIALFIDAYKATNTFTGEIIEECKNWWESNLNLIFQPHLVKDFFENEVDHLQFQVTHLKMLKFLDFVQVMASCNWQRIRIK
jgi:hypothetical protein